MSLSKRDLIKIMILMTKLKEIMIVKEYNNFMMHDSINVWKESKVDGEISLRSRNLSKLNVFIIKKYS